MKRIVVQVALLTIVSPIFSKMLKSNWYGDIPKGNEVVNKKSPRGDIKAMAYLEHQQTIVTERNNTTRIYSYNSVTDDFELKHTADFTDIENSCSDRQYGFIDARQVKTLYVMSCTKDDGVTTVYFVDHVDGKNEYLKLISNKKFLGLDTNDDFKILAQFEDSIWMFDVKAGFQASIETSMFDEEVSYVNFWHNKSLLVLTKYNAYVVDLETKKILQKAQTPCNTIAATGYYENQNIWMVSSSDYSLEKSVIYTNTAGTLDFHEIRVQSGTYSSSITKVYNDMATDYMYTWDRHRMTVLIPNSEINGSYYSVDRQIDFPGSLNELQFMKSLNGKDHGIFVGFSDQILTTWTYGHQSVSVLDISPNVKTAKSNSYGRHLLLDHKEHKDIIRINADSKIDFIFRSDIFGEFIESYYIENASKDDPEHSYFQLFTQNNNKTTVNVKRLTISYGHYTYSYCGEYKTFPVDAFGRQTKLIHFNKDIDKFIICNPMNCIVSNDRCDKDSQITYDVDANFFHGIWHDNNRVILTSAFDSFVYNKANGKQENLNYIQRGGDQIVQHDKFNDHGHLVYGKGMVWSFNIDAVKPDEMINHKVLMSQAYDYSPIYKDSFLLRDKRGFTLHDTNDITKIKHRIPYELDDIDNFLYQKKFQDQNTYSVTLTNVYSKFYFQIESKDPSLVHVTLTKTHPRHENLLGSTQASTFRLDRPHIFTKERILSEIVESDNDSQINKEHFRLLVYVLVSICAIFTQAITGFIVYTLMDSSKQEVAKSVDMKYSTKKTDIEMADMEREARYQANMMLFSTINGKPMDGTDLYY